MFKKKLLLFFTLFITYLSANEAFDVRIPVRVDTNDTRPDYFIKLIEMSMEKTKDKYGEYSIVYASEDMVQERALNKVKHNGGIDLYWVMTSIERENEFRPIRIPLIKGLLGYRICIIRKDNVEKFKNITTIDQVKKLLLVQGNDWPDTQILEANGFNVYRMSVYETMFKMVSSGRVDFFPRGVNEPYEEVRARPELKLTVDSHIMIQYTAPMYFFVNKDNTILAKRVEEGLRIAIEDGDFNKHFYSHPTTVAIFNEAKMGNRLIFKLDNPIMPPETPVDDPILWYNP